MFSYGGVIPDINMADMAWAMMITTVVEKIA